VGLGRSRRHCSRGAGSLRDCFLPAGLICFGRSVRYRTSASGKRGVHRRSPGFGPVSRPVTPEEVFFGETVYVYHLPAVPVAGPLRRVLRLVRDHHLTLIGQKPRPPRGAERAIARLTCWPDGPGCRRGEGLRQAAGLTRADIGHPVGMA